MSVSMAADEDARIARRFRSPAQLAICKKHFAAMPFRTLRAEILVTPRVSIIEQCKVWCRRAPAPPPVIQWTGNSNRLATGLGHGCSPCAATAAHFCRFICNTSAQTARMKRCCLACRSLFVQSSKRPTLCFGKPRSKSRHGCDGQPEPN
jgi:hypothetical protein